MRYITVLALFFVAFCLMSTGFVATADDAKKKEPAAAASSKKEKDAKPEKAAKDAKKAEPKKESDKKEKAKAEAAKKPVVKPEAKKPVHEVKAGPFQVSVVLKGVFEAKRTAPVSIWPKQWAAYMILKAAEHGKAVKQGELLIAFDPEKIDEAIEDLRSQIKLSDIEMTRLAEQVAAMEKLSPMDLAAVERRQRNAEQDFDRFMKVELPMSKKMSDFSLKRANEELVYAKEELSQLEKMYKADDMTEETEEIVLRRARNQVAEAEVFLKMAKLRHEEMKKMGFPRSVESAKESIERGTLGNRQAKVLLPLTLKKSWLELEKNKVARERLDQRLKELLADRALMTVKAPADGVVYYGECVDGKWTGMTMPAMFQRGASLPGKKVLMTVVETRPVLIRAAASENEIRYVREGVKGKARPVAYPQKAIDAVVTEVATAPNAQNQFDTRLLVTDQDVAPVMPGMTCVVKLIAYKTDKALTIPPTALGTDKDDDLKYFVHVVGKDGKSARRDVEVGERTAEAVEIVKGLSAGDKVLKVCPKDEETTNKK
ncbi:MAG TPA: HlyD family efflux transporter periplasmic adaptor subunit [Thermoguttaceae bacterium]|nr:HlyD family efflux transporter periplasmic adaptor subunit [Thermoguttaceae bacterium]